MTHNKGVSMSMKGIFLFLLTNIAVILGTLAAGVIADTYSPPTPIRWLPGVAMVTVAEGQTIDIF